MSMSFYDRLAEAARRNDSLLCVGLDPQLGPPDRPVPGDAFLDLNRRIVDATQDLVCCYKPNYAFYEAAGPAGLQALHDTIAYIHATAQVPVLLDAKRGDIGSTAAAYARAAFDVWGADALTVNPYLGADSIQPFTAYADRGVFVLCHTSNPGAIDLQTLPCPARPLYERVALKAAEWRTGLVAGATFPEALARVRALAPDAWILLPGIGAQGGDLYAALQATLRDDGLGVIVNSSRGIVQAADPRQAALDLKRQINAVRALPRERQAGALERELAVALADIGAVKFGEFTLASGKKSPVYVDLRLLVSYPGVLRLVAHAYAELLERELAAGGQSFDVVLAAIPYAALPIGTAVSLETGLPLVYPRKEAKAHGTGRAVEGEFQPGDRAIVLDDVITTGGSKLQAIEPLASAGLKVEDVVVLIDREQGGRAELEAAGYRLHAVLCLTDMLDVLLEAGRIDARQRQAVLEYLRG